MLEAFAELNLVLVAVALVAAMLLQGFAGFGSGLLAVPLLLNAGAGLDQALALFYPIVFIQCNGNLWPRREAIPWEVTGRYIPLMLVGLVAGASTVALLTRLADPAWIKFGVGGLIVATFLVQVLVRPEPRERIAWPITLAAALLGGFLNGCVGMGGPPLVLWLLAQGFAGERLRLAIWSVMLAASLPALILLSVINGWQLLWLSAGSCLLAPLIWLAAFSGNRLGDRLSHGWTRRLAWGLLLVIAAQALLTPLVE